MYLLYLLLCIVIMNGVHVWLLASQRMHRKESISEHAAHSDRTHMIYMVSHLCSGLLFLLFARSFFVARMDSLGLFYLAAFAVAFEWLQALLPARGKTNLAHSVIAYIMWVSFIVLGGLCLMVLNMGALQRVLGAILYLPVPFIFGYVHMRREKLYKYQMIMAALYFSMLIILVV